jgi:hypothetical protein
MVDSLTNGNADELPNWDMGLQAFDSDTQRRCVRLMAPAISEVS